MERPEKIVKYKISKSDGASVQKREVSDPMSRGKARMRSSAEKSGASRGQVSATQHANQQSGKPSDGQNSSLAGQNRPQTGQNRPSISGQTSGAKSTTYSVKSTTYSVKSGQSAQPSAIRSISQSKNAQKARNMNLRSSFSDTSLSQKKAPRMKCAAADELVKDSIPGNDTKKGPVKGRKVGMNPFSKTPAKGGRIKFHENRQNISFGNAKPAVKKGNKAGAKQAKNELKNAMKEIRASGKGKGESFKQTEPEKAYYEQQKRKKQKAVGKVVTAPITLPLKAGAAAAGVGTLTGVLAAVIPLVLSLIPMLAIVLVLIFCGFFDSSPLKTDNDFKTDLFGEINYAQYITDVTHDVLGTGFTDAASYSAMTYYMTQNKIPTQDEKGARESDTHAAIPWKCLPSEGSIEHIWSREECDNVTKDPATGKSPFGDPEYYYGDDENIPTGVENYRYESNPDARTNLSGVSANLAPIISMAHYKYAFDWNFDNYQQVMAYVFTVYVNSHDLAKYDSNAKHGANWKSAFSYTASPLHSLADIYGVKSTSSFGWEGESEGSDSSDSSFSSVSRNGNKFYYGGEDGFVYDAEKEELTHRLSYENGKCDNVYYHGTPQNEVVNFFATAICKLADIAASVIGIEDFELDQRGVERLPDKEGAVYVSDLPVDGLNELSLKPYIDDLGKYVACDHVMYVQAGIDDIDDNTTFAIKDDTTCHLSEHVHSASCYTVQDEEKKTYTLKVNSHTCSDECKVGCTDEEGSIGWNSYCNFNYSNKTFNSEKEAKDAKKELEKNYTCDIDNNLIVSGHSHTTLEDSDLFDIYGNPRFGDASTLYVWQVVNPDGSTSKRVDVNCPATESNGWKEGDDYCRYALTCGKAYHKHDPWNSNEDPGCWRTSAICLGHCGGHITPVADVSVIYSWEGLASVSPTTEASWMSESDFQGAREEISKALDGLVSSYGKVSDESYSVTTEIASALAQKKIAVGGSWRNHWLNKTARWYRPGPNNPISAIAFLSEEGISTGLDIASTVTNFGASAINWVKANTIGRLTGGEGAAFEFDAGQATSMLLSRAASFAGNAGADPSGAAEFLKNTFGYSDEELKSVIKSYENFPGWYTYEDGNNYLTFDKDILKDLILVYGKMDDDYEEGISLWKEFDVEFPIGGIGNLTAEQIAEILEAINEAYPRLFDTDPARYAVCKEALTESGWFTYQCDYAGHVNGCLRTQGVSECTGFASGVLCRALDKGHSTPNDSTYPMGMCGFHNPDTGSMGEPGYWGVHCFISNDNHAIPGSDLRNSEGKEVLIPWTNSKRPGGSETLYGDSATYALPGDVLVNNGHVLIYLGRGWTDPVSGKPHPNGYQVECYGGGGSDYHEFWYGFNPNGDLTAHDYPAIYRPPVYTIRTPDQVASDWTK